MKLRIANKIMSDGMNVTRYRGSTMLRAFRRQSRTPNGKVAVALMTILRGQWTRLSAFLTESNDKLAS